MTDPTLAGKPEWSHPTPEDELAGWPLSRLVSVYSKAPTPELQHALITRGLTLAYWALQPVDRPAALISFARSCATGIYDLELLHLAEWLTLLPGLDAAAALTWYADIRADLDVVTSLEDSEKARESDEAEAARERAASNAVSAVEASNDGEGLTRFDHCADCHTFGEVVKVAKRWLCTTCSISATGAEL